MPLSAMIPPRICAMSNKCSQAVGLLNALGIKSAICCLVLTYSMRIRGLEQTSNSHCKSILCVRGRCLRDMDLAFLTILITASLSSATIKTVVAVVFWVYAKYFLGSNCVLYGFMSSAFGLTTGVSTFFCWGPRSSTTNSQNASAWRPSVRMACSAATI